MGSYEYVVDTDNVFIAHRLADGSWVQNRSVDNAGTVGTRAFGNAGTACSDLNEMVTALKRIGILECDAVGAGTKCLAGAGAGAIDDLAKFNLTFFIDPTGFTKETDTQFTLRYASSLVPAEVPEPGALALIMLGLGALGVTTRRRKTA